MRSVRLPTIGARAVRGHWRPLWIATVLMAATVPGLHILAAPTGHAPAGPTPALVGPADPSQDPVVVAVRDEGFMPRVVTVTVGSVVRWTNHAQQLHSTTSDDVFSWSWTLPPGVTYAGRFLTAGTFPYHCVFHPTMTGVVVVTAGQSTPATPGPSPTATRPPGTAAPIAYWYGDNVSPYRPDLFALDPDTAASAQLTHTPSLDEVNPSWAPDYRRMAYAAGVIDGSPTQQLSIWVRDQVAGAAVAVTGGPLDFAPDWHPDGTGIAFTHYERQGDAYSSEIAVVAPDGSGRRTLLRVDGPNLGVRTPAWSPDGARLAFVLSSAVGGDLYVMDADGRNARPLFDHPGWDDVDPQWSPLGRYVAFSSGPSQGIATQHDIWLLNTATGQAGAVAQSPTWDLRYPAWSPDGRRLVFEAGDSLQLYLVPASGGTITGPLTRGADPDWAVASLVPLLTPAPGPTVAAPTAFPTPPTPSPTAPGPTATRPVVPTFPPPTSETPGPTPTGGPSATAARPTAPTAAARRVYLPRTLAEAASH
jgi:TolB protein